MTRAVLRTEAHELFSRHRTAATVGGNLSLAVAASLLLRRRRVSQRGA